MGYLDAHILCILFFCHRFNNIKVHLEKYLSEMEEKITFNKRNWNHFYFMVVRCLEVRSNIFEDVSGIHTQTNYHFLSCPLQITLFLSLSPHWLLRLSGTGC